MPLCLFISVFYFFVLIYCENELNLGKMWRPGLRIFFSIEDLNLLLLEGRGVTVNWNFIIRYPTSRYLVYKLAIYCSSINLCLKFLFVCMFDLGFVWFCCVLFSVPRGRTEKIHFVFIFKLFSFLSRQGDFFFSHSPVSDDVYPSKIPGIVLV